MIDTAREPAPETPDFHAPTHPYRWAMLAGVWLVYFSFGVLVASMAPLVAPITTELGITHTAMGTVLGAWPLVYIAASLPAGALIDRMGPRRSLMLCTVLITFSGILRGFADDYLSMFLAVAVFGLGGPLISIGAPKVMSLWFERRERAMAMGLYVSGPAIGNIVSLSLTNSVLMPFYGGQWRAVLFTYAGVAVVCGLLWVLISAHPASRTMERRIAAEPKRPQLQVFGELLSKPGGSPHPSDECRHVHLQPWPQQLVARDLAHRRHGCGQRRLLGLNSDCRGYLRGADHSPICDRRAPHPGARPAHRRRRRGKRCCCTCRPVRCWPRVSCVRASPAAP